MSLDNPCYKKLMTMEPLGFIDPLRHLGTFDGHLLTFREPVSSLKNPYSGKPYSLAWQEKIEEMRLAYKEYYLSLMENLDGVTERRGYLTDPKTKERMIRRIRLYLELGFRISEIARREHFVEKTIRNNWTRSRHFTTQRPHFYSKHAPSSYHSLSEFWEEGASWCLARWSEEGS